MIEKLRVSRLIRLVPAGTLPVGAGLLVYGITSYVFLIVAARALGPERYAGLSVLWALLYLLAPGILLPIEQEIGRTIAASRARGTNWGGTARRATILGGAFLASVLVATLVLAGPVTRTLFDGDELLLLSLAIGLVAYLVQHVVRGVLAGTGRFRRYGWIFGLEGLLRAAGAVALALAGTRLAGAFGLLLGVAPLLSTVAVAGGKRKPVSPPASGAWGDLTRALGSLLASSLLAQFLANAGPLTVKLLAGPGEGAEAGRFLAGLILARIPLFLFQAVQAALLPQLSSFAAAGRRDRLVRSLARLIGAVVGTGAISVAVALAAGPSIMGFLFGDGFAMNRVDLATLAAATAMYMGAIGLSQGLIALGAHPRVAAGWLMGTLVFVATAAFGSDLLVRVELAFLLGSAAAAIAMFFLLKRPLALLLEERPEEPAPLSVPVEF